MCIPWVVLMLVASSGGCGIVNSAAVRSTLGSGCIPGAAFGNEARGRLRASRYSNESLCGTLSVPSSAELTFTRSEFSPRKLLKNGLLWVDLEGKTAVVVGGTSGIGQAIALGLAHVGADIIATGRRPDQAEEVAAEIEAIGRRSLSITVDVNDGTSLEHLLSAVLNAFGKVDILVNSAGRIMRRPT